MAIPAPTLADVTVDYIAATKRRYTFVPTIAVAGSPTAAELTAGTDYTPVLTAVAGFAVTAADVDNATFASNFNTTIPGVRSSSSSTWTLKADSTSTDARATLTEGTNGYVVIYPEGITTGNKCSVWPVRISSVSVDSVARDALATITVTFSIPEPPVENIAIPSA